MNHHEHEWIENEKDCCGAGCCEIYNDSGSKVGSILTWVLLGWAFVCSLLTLILMPKIIRKEIVSEQALKAGGIENYMKLNKEIYDAPEYKERMKQEVEMFIQQSKAQMEMMKNQEQQADPSTMLPIDESGAVSTGSTATGN